MSNKKQTAIEWLAKELLEKYHLKIDEYKEFKQAKAMHKQDIINALHYFGIENVEQYYNKTFNSDEA
jgi:hypothetical protein